ncbi:unnamed protein product [Parnassius mnemosyne]|uniref:Ig-like domain-containing protein n=1 Tax=Parnassius mnemosyne TaxID=213953 RepID=A0AAV1MC38_9NEOP
MARASFCLSVALTHLFLAIVVPSNAQNEEMDQPELLYDVRANFTLRCELHNDNSLAYVWTKNDTNVVDIWDLKDRYKLVHVGAEFIMPRSVEDDFGNYTCGLSGTETVQRWAVRGRAFTKLPANTNVVEGQKLKLQCKVVGKPYPRVVWTFSNASEGENANDVRAALGERVILRRSAQGVEYGELLLDAELRSVAGLYSCVAPVGAAGAANVATTTLRVKDMYAAL